MSPFGIFWDYFETNRFTVVLAVVVGACAALRRVRARLDGGRRGFFVAALVLGVLLRAGWIGFSSYEPKTAWSSGPMLESDAANVHALELARGIWFHSDKGQPTARRPIGYPMLLGLCYRLFGSHAVVPWILNILLFALSLLFLYRLARELLGPAAASWTAILYAIYPISVYSAKLVTDEHLFLPLWYGGIYLLVREAAGRRVRRAWLAYGLIFGYAAMTRTHAIFMPLVVAFVYAASGRSWRSALGAFAGVLLVMQFINLPWAIRNQKAFGAPVLYTATNQFVYPAFNPAAEFDRNAYPAPGAGGYSEELEKARHGTVNEGEYHAIAGREMARWAAREPLAALRLGAGHVLLFIGWDKRGVWPIWFQYSEGAYDPSRPVSQRAKDALETAAYAFYYVLFFCFFAGSWLLFRERRAFSRPARTGLSAAGLCFLFYLILQMVIYADRKYRFPLEPLMIAVTAYFLCRLSACAGPGGAVSERGRA